MKLRAMLLAMIMWAPLGWAETVWIDVRTPGEFNTGHIETAKNIEYQNIVSGVNGLKLEKDTEILLYCRSGRRASFALSALQEAGYTKVQNLGSLEGARGYQDSLKYRK
tara:strand:+ start:243 stop:569 length:327 start_codon:yes stop_codon:yes gene_type:complete